MREQRAHRSIKPGSLTGGVSAGAVPRELTYGALLVVGYLGDGSQTAVVFAGLVTGVSLLSRVWRCANGHRLSPVALWELGFLMILLPEMLLDVTSVERSFGLNATTHAVRLLIGGHAAVVIICDRMGARARRAKPTSSFERVRPIAAWTLVPTACLAILVWAPRVVENGLSGRIAVANDVGSGAIGSIALAAGLVMPTLIAHRILESEKPSLLKVYLWSSPFILVAAISGSRFYLLFAVLGPVAYLVSTRRTTPRMLVSAALIGAFLGLASSAMLSFRAEGLNAAGGASAFEDVSLSQVIHPEGVLRSDAELIVFSDRQGYRSGESYLAIALFAVPRAMWHDKPELLGYWFPHTMSDDVGIAHSVAFGYIGDGYADWGPAGAVLESVVIGLLLGLLQHQALTGGSPTRMGRIFGALSYPASFFAVRSPVTTLIICTGVIFFVLLAEGMEGLDRTLRNSGHQRMARPIVSPGSKR